MTDRAPLAGAPVVRPCDFCKDPVAPHGHAPAPRLGIPVRRPIQTCTAQVCRDQARARVADLIARHDPLAGHRHKRATDPAQKKLL